jgi:hypothetical protein
VNRDVARIYAPQVFVLEVEVAQDPEWSTHLPGNFGLVAGSRYFVA